ncbi:MAG: hypothetical protein V2A54_16350 [Bacteroidota bacterium]
MEKFIELLLPALLSGAFISTVMGLILKRRTGIIEAEIKNQFEANMTIFKAGYQWKEKALSELLGKIYVQFNRTKSALYRYHETNLYLEAKVLKEGNEAIRNLLLEKAYLIPIELLKDANELIKHYDVWLEEFDKLRGNVKPDLNHEFVFVGPKGFPFPKDAEAKFKKKYLELWNELYDKQS